MSKRPGLHSTRQLGELRWVWWMQMWNQWWWVQLLWFGRGRSGISKNDKLLWLHFNTKH